MRRLVPDDAAAGCWDPNRAGRVGAECRVGEAGRDGGRRAPARPARDAARETRVRHVAEVRVLGGRPVRELVQVRLADVRVTRVLEQPHRRRRLRGHVAGEDRRAVGRLEPGRVEQILHREPDPGRGRIRPGEEDRHARFQICVSATSRLSGITRSKNELVFRNTSSGVRLVEGDVEERDPDRAGEEEHEDPEQRPAEDEVLALELRGDLFHRSTGFRAAATKSSAR